MYILANKLNDLVYKFYYDNYKSTYNYLNNLDESSKYELARDIIRDTKIYPQPNRYSYLRGWTIENFRTLLDHNLIDITSKNYGLIRYALFHHNNDIIEIILENKNFNICESYELLYLFSKYYENNKNIFHRITYNCNNIKDFKHDI